MQLELRFAHGRLRFWDRETAQYRQLPEEEAEAQIESIERALKAEKRARKALEARLAKFEAESRSTRDPT